MGIVNANATAGGVAKRVRSVAGLSVQDPGACWQCLNLAGLLVGWEIALPQAGITSHAQGGGKRSSLP